ncbi:MAG: SMI1/KNR4 family protein [Kangiellaceae bacterium]|nr:SMI1/KNR4 family protein [Kangiellaceae bacterium]MCW9000165.1 SMI1/KNR4 family protein [Kangiellaceae bacterium]MCW9015608.1 SMI1/KNR4 family protein [Kangiellaceae bacterium]
MNYDKLIQQVESKGNETFWFGKTDIVQVEKLESMLGLILPSSFKEFLENYGGGGIVESEISGIEDNDAELDYGGTVWGDTVTCREDYELPDNLAVIFFKDDEVCWCLDCNLLNEFNECPVVSYNLFNKSVDREMSSSFKDFFVEYLELRAQ